LKESALPENRQVCSDRIDPYEWPLSRPCTCCPSCASWPNALNGFEAIWSQSAAAGGFPAAAVVLGRDRDSRLPRHRGLFLSIIEFELLDSKLRAGRNELRNGHKFHRERGFCWQRNFATLY
jgi:hypothetical protein